MNVLEQKVELLSRIAVAETEAERDAAASELRRLLEEPNQRRPDAVEDVVRGFLMEIGVSCRLTGYQHLIAAVTSVVEDPEMTRVATKGLYPKVAEECRTTPPKVERAMRHAIETVWSRCDLDVLERYFGNSICIAKGKPTNMEFVARAAEIVKCRLKAV